MSSFGYDCSDFGCDTPTYLTRHEYRLLTHLYKNNNIIYTINRSSKLFYRLDIKDYKYAFI